MLVHLKFYLRSITNTLMDLRIHAGSMDQAEAMELMVEGGFQEEGEATNKWDRARLSSTQLCEYFLGSIGMHDLEADARRRAAERNQEFVYRPFLESVLAHGAVAAGDPRHPDAGLSGRRLSGRRLRPASAARSARSRIDGLPGAR